MVWFKFYRINICWFHILSNKYLLMSYFIVLTLYLLNTELISIFLLNNELRTPPPPPSRPSFKIRHLLLLWQVFWAKRSFGTRRSFGDTECSNGLWKCNLERIPWHIPWRHRHYGERSKLWGLSWYMTPMPKCRNVYTGSCVCPSCHMNTLDLLLWTYSPSTQLNLTQKYVCTK